MNAPRAPISLKARALRLLSMREHSRIELERKLSRYAEDAGEIKSLLDALEAQGWISEARVVESVLHQKSGRLGVNRLRQELRQRGIGEASAAAALEEFKTTEFERARDVWRRKFGVSPDGPQAYARQVRFLTYRGFGTDTIRRVLSSADPDMNDCL